MHLRSFLTFPPLDFQNRVWSKFGGGGVADASQANIDRRERLRKLALETIDLAKVPQTSQYLV